MRDQTPRRVHQIHPVIPAGLAVVVVALLVSVIARSADGDGPTPTTASTSTSSTEPTTTTTTLPDPVPVDPYLAPATEEVARSYRIEYDIVENGLARTETWTVRRPYEAVVVSRRDGELLSGTATSLTALRTYLGEQKGWLNVQAERHRAAYDMRPGGALTALVEMGLFQERGRQTWAGRPCTAYRTGGPTTGSEIKAPSPEEQTYVCIDADGLVLHERWLLDGRTVTERTATAVETDIDIDPSIFDPGPQVANQDEFAAALPSLAVVADEKTLAERKTDIDVPEGYRSDGAVLRASTSSQGSVSSAEVVRFYSSGTDLLEMAEFSIDGRADLSSSGSVRIAFDGWDEVWLEPGLSSSTLRVRTSEFGYVELRHPDISFLVDVLGTLRLVED